MPEPTQQEIDKAVALLRTIPEYRPLTEYQGSGILGVGDAARLSHISEHLIRKYAGEGRFHGAIEYDYGWRIPYSALVTYVAEQYRRSNPRADEAAG